MHKMVMLPKIKPHSDAVDYFNELTFHKKFIEKWKVKRLKNIDWLVEFTFYEQLSIIEEDKAFRGYAMTYKVERIEKKIFNCTIRSK